MKELWRLKWKNFIEKSLTGEQLHEAKVVCMPSINVALEVSKYLELGIQPENIYAVEHAIGKSQEIFIKNCREIGINPLCGKLHDEISQIKDITILNLDFHGMMSRNKIDCLLAAHTSKEAVVIMNCLAKREFGLEDLPSVSRVVPLEYQEITYLISDLIKIEKNCKN